MVKNEILKKAINGEMQNIKMFELIALCSSHIDEFSSEEASKISERYDRVFWVSPLPNGERAVFVRKNGIEKEKAKAHLVDLMKCNKLSFNLEKIVFC